MIQVLKKYPKANKSVLQKAQYEQKIQVQILKTFLYLIDIYHNI